MLKRMPQRVSGTASSFRLRKEKIMDALLKNYSDSELLHELETGHYWFAGGRFYSNEEKPRTIQTASVENAVYLRFYS